MRHWMQLGVVSALLAAAIAGCGQNQPPAGAKNAESQNAEAAAPAATTYLLAKEPAGAKDVKAVRKAAQDGDEVVVVGRIGGDRNPWVEGAAAFTVVDMALKPCEDGCDAPWDYCCDLADLPASKALVKIVDQDGRSVTVDSRKLLGVKELQTVVSRGKAKRDEAGNLTILASGVFVRP